MRIGDVFLINIIGVPNTEEPKKLYWALNKFLLQYDFNIIRKHTHKFINGAETGFFLLSESHLAYHTWPEHSFAMVDLFTCKTTIISRDDILNFFYDKYPNCMIEVKSEKIRI